MNDSIIADEDLMREISALNSADPPTEIDQQAQLNYQEEIYENQRDYYQLAGYPW